MHNPVFSETNLSLCYNTVLAYKLAKAFIKVNN